MKLIDKSKIKLKEDSTPVTYSIVPKNQDAQSRNADQQISALKGKVQPNDDITVDPQAVNEETEEEYYNRLSKNQDEDFIKQEDEYFNSLKDEYQNDKKVLPYGYTIDKDGVVYKNRKLYGYWSPIEQRIKGMYERKMTKGEIERSKLKNKMKNESVLISKNKFNKLLIKENINDPYIDYFKDLIDTEYAKSGVSRRDLARLTSLGIPFNNVGELINLFNNDETYHTTQWIERVLPSLKIINKKGLTDEANIKKIQDLANTVGASGISNKFSNKIDYHLGNEGSYDQLQRGDASSQFNVGAVQSAEKTKEQSLNDFIKFQVDKLKKGEEISPESKMRIMQQISLNREDPRALTRKEPDKATQLQLRKMLNNPNLNDETRQSLQNTLNSLEQQQGGAVTKSNWGEDKVDPNILLQYAALTNDFDLVDKAFNLINRDVTANKQGRGQGGRFGTKLSKELLNNPKISDTMKQTLIGKGLKEHKILIINNKQVKVLKEHFNKLNEEYFSPIDKEIMSDINTALSNTNMQATYITNSMERNSAMKIVDIENMSDINSLMPLLRNSLGDKYNFSVRDRNSIFVKQKPVISNEGPNAWNNIPENKMISLSKKQLIEKILREQEQTWKYNDLEITPDELDNVALNAAENYWYDKMNGNRPTSAMREFFDNFGETDQDATIYEDLFQTFLSLYAKHKSDPEIQEKYQERDEEAEYAEFLSKYDSDEKIVAALSLDFPDIDWQLLDEVVKFHNKMFNMPASYEKYEAIWKSLRPMVKNYEDINTFLRNYLNSYNRINTTESKKIIKPKL